MGEKKDTPKEKQSFKKLQDNTEAVFVLKKTDKADVYKIYLLAGKRGDGDRIITKKVKKIGIASIPTAECSKMCRELMGSKDRALVYCRYIKKSDRWEPVRECTDRDKPDHVSEIYEAS